MKRIRAIVHPAKVTDVCSALDNAGFRDMTITGVSGQAGSEGWTQQARGMAWRVDSLDRTSVEIITRDEDADLVVTIIRKAACTGNRGSGMIFVHNVDDAIRIRTTESGSAVL